MSSPSTSAALDVHRRLLDLVRPRSLRLSPDGRTLAFIAPGAPGADPAVQLLPLGSPQFPDAGSTVAYEPRALPAPDGEPVLVRWSPEATRLWVVHTRGGEPAHLVLCAIDVDCATDVHSAADSQVLAETVVDGAIEDVLVLDDRHALLRAADPGSERDGMHLGLRVTAPSDPRVDDVPGPWRRLHLVTVTGGRLQVRPLPLPGWTVWDVDARGDRLALVASREPLPAGYYEPTLLTARLALDSDDGNDGDDGDGDSDDDKDGHDKSGGARLTDVTELWSPGPTAQLACPRLSPNPRDLYVIRGLSIVSGQVMRFDLTTGRHTVLPDLDDVTDLGFVDDARLWFSGWDGTGVQVGLVTDPAGPAPRVSRWTDVATLHGDAGQPALAVAPDGGQAFAVREAPASPPEVVRLGFTGPEPTELTGYNTCLRDLAPEVTTEVRTWASPDGTVVQGLLLRPAETTGPCPLVTLLHGGPTWLWSAAFAPAESNDLALTLAAAGAAVLLPNPRGSSGRGQAFARAIIGQMSTIDLDDVLAGVHDLVSAGTADPERLAVMGLSYGGYLSAVASSRTQVFAAAVVMSGVVDWLSFAGTSAIGGGYDRTYHPGGDVRTAHGREVLAGRSPAYDERPSRTPVLVLHGAADRITPLAQAEQLFRSRRAAGVETELVVYPGEGHELTDRAHRTDAAQRCVSWLAQYRVLQ